jgi:Protein of unknown function (DUF2764).
MNNYHYIISGLPDLVFGSDLKDFSYDSIRNSIYEMCSDKDKRLIDWLEFGYDENNLSPTFYSNVINKDNKFISNYYILDLMIRNKKVSYVASRAKKESVKTNSSEAKEIEKFAILLNEKCRAKMPESTEERLTQIFDIQNILEKELAIDKYKWETINEIITFDYFNIDVILAFLAKAKIIERWSKLDKVAGKEMFVKLVNEVRGTFKGIDSNSIK